MVVAVALVHVVEVPVDEVVDVIPVRDRLVAAARTVRVTHLVPGARMLACAAVRVLRIDGDDMVVDVVAVGVMQVTVVEIVEMSLVHDGPVAASGSVDVRVLAGVRDVLGHVPTVCTRPPGVQASQMRLTRTDASRARRDGGP